ncbi:MAG: hypothetical protein H6R16_3661, partial [Proteobacteria bacterium]|nr:hypothetical protein [Pseudomonadota bacterium]
MAADIEGWHEVCACCSDATRAADVERGGWGLIGAGIGPFPQGGLDETLCLAVGLRRVGLGPQMVQPQAQAKPGEAPGFVAGTVISQNLPEGDAERAVVAQGRQKGPAS